MFSQLINLRSRGEALKKDVIDVKSFVPRITQEKVT
jgi:hypothetical protein